MPLQLLDMVVCICKTSPNLAVMLTGEGGIFATHDLLIH